MANSRGPLNSSDPTTSVLVGGVYNEVAPAPADQQACALQLDSEGNLLVNVAVGGGGGSSTVKIEDTSGNALNSNGAGALQVAVVSGGGSNASVGTVGAATPTSATTVGGTDGTDLRVLATDTSGQLKVLVENASAIPVSLLAGQAVELLDSGGTNKASISAGGALKVDGTGGSFPVSGTVTADIVGHAGATLDGTAGSPSTGVLTVQGVSGGQTIPVTAAQATAANLNAQVQGATADGTAIVGNPVLIGGMDLGGITRTLPVSNIGDAPASKAVIMGGLRPSGAGVGIPLLQNAGGPVGSGAVVIALSNTVGVTDGFTNIIPQVSLGGADAIPAVAPMVYNGSTWDRIREGSSIGSVKVDGSAVTQPISGIVTVVGDAASGAAVAGNPVLVAGSDGTDARTLSTNSSGQLQVESVSGSTTAVTQATAANLNATVIGTGTFAVQASQATAANLKAEAILLDAGGTNLGTVKAASTAAAATDTSLVVQINPAQPNLTTALNVQAVSGSTTAVTQATAANLNATVAQPTAANLNATVVGTGTFAVQAAQATAASLNATVVPGGSAIFEVSPTTAANTNANPFFNSITDGTTKATVIAATAALKTDLSSVAGTATVAASAGIQKVGISGNAGASVDAAINSGAAPANVVWTSPAPVTVASGAVTPKYIASTAQAVLKATPGNLYGLYLLNLFDTSTTTAPVVVYVQFYNTTTTTGLTTATWLFSLPLPAPSINTGTVAATGTAMPLSLPPGALALANFSSGIVVVFNTTSTSATTASGTAPTGVIWIE